MENFLNRSVSGTGNRESFSRLSSPGSRRWLGWCV